MRNAARGVIAAAVAALVATSASAQGTSYYGQTIPAPQYQQAPATPYQPGQVVTIPQTGTGGYGVTPFPGVPAGTTTYGGPQPQPYFPGQPGQPYFPGQPQVVQPPQGGGQAQDPGAPDTDTWSFNLPAYFRAISACLRRSTVNNPVIANVQVRDNSTVMLIGQGGTADFSVCTTGLSGTTIREGSSERSIPPVFYAPVGSVFTVGPDRPLQPVVDTANKLVGWMVRTTPVRLDLNGGRVFDGQYIPPVQVNTEVR